MDFNFKVIIEDVLDYIGIDYDFIYFNDNVSQLILNKYNIEFNISLELNHNLKVYNLETYYDERIELIYSPYYDRPICSLLSIGEEVKESLLDFKHLASAKMVFTSGNDFKTYFINWVYCILERANDEALLKRIVGKYEKLLNY